MDFEKFKPCVVLNFLNVNVDYDEVFAIENNECMMNEIDGDFSSRFVYWFLRGRKSDFGHDNLESMADDNFERRRKKIFLLEISTL